jgi:hypothetical protein
VTQHPRLGGRNQAAHALIQQRTHGGETLGYPLDSDAARDIFEILEDRAHRGSTLIVSQVPIENWYDILAAPTIADASRADVPESERKPLYLYVDEVHNFLTPSFADILSEARKYGLSLILAHQHLEQLDEKVRSAIFGNVGTMISFRAGAEDARLLAREFWPVFDAGDFISLPRYHIYLKLMIDGTTSRPFSARTLPSPGIGNTLKSEICEFSRLRYGRPM